MWTVVVLAAQVFNNDSHIVNTKLAKRNSYSYLMNFLLSIQPFNLWPKLWAQFSLALAMAVAEAEDDAGTLAVAMDSFSLDPRFIWCEKFSHTCMKRAET